MKKKTVGEVSVELNQKTADNISVLEQQEGMQQEYIKNLEEVSRKALHKYGSDNTFFIEVITKKEPLMQNVLRNYFIERTTCPTPNYDQSVFMYEPKKERIVYLWTIPCRDACIHLLENTTVIHKDEEQLLRNVKLFESGYLFQWCKELNKELPDSPLLS
jgi:hypothetical protein